MGQIDQRGDEPYHADDLFLGGLAVLKWEIDPEADLAVLEVHLDLDDLGLPVKLVEGAQDGGLRLRRGILGQAVGHGSLDAQEFAVFLEPDHDVHAVIAVFVGVEVGGEAGADDVILQPMSDVGGVEEGGDGGEGGGHGDG